MNFNYSDYNNIINGNPISSVNFTQSYRASLATNFRDKPNLEIGYSYNKRKYDTGNSKNYFFTDSPYARLDAYFGKGFVFTANYTYNYYRNEEVTLNKYRFLEADLSYNKEGSKWEFGLGVTNYLMIHQLIEIVLISSIVKQDLTLFSQDILFLD